MAPVQTLSLPRLTMRPEALASISKTMRPGVADTVSFCLRGIPPARRSSRESTIRLEASSSMVVFTALLWRGHGVFASSSELSQPALIVLYTRGAKEKQTRPLRVGIAQCRRSTKPSNSFDRFFGSRPRVQERKSPSSKSAPRWSLGMIPRQSKRRVKFLRVEKKACF
jgi:hypothetical protein